MTFLESLIKGYFRDQRTLVQRNAHDDSWRVSITYSEKDLAYFGRTAEAARELVRPLEPTRRVRRRLHWGRKR